MAKPRKLLRKVEFVYGIVALWVVLGLLVGVVCFIPADLPLENTMARVAYGLVCFVTVWCGLYAWTQLKEYIDVMYEKYVKRTTAKWAEENGKAKAKGSRKVEPGQV